MEDLGTEIKGAGATKTNKKRKPISKAAIGRKKSKLENDILSGTTKPKQNVKTKVAPKKATNRKGAGKKSNIPAFATETLADLTIPKTRSQRIARMTKQVKEASGKVSPAKEKPPVKRRILTEKLTSDTIVDQLFTQTPAKAKEPNKAIEDAMKTPLRNVK